MGRIQSFKSRIDKDIFLKIAVTKFYYLAILDLVCQNPALSGMEENSCLSFLLAGFHVLQNRFR